VEPDYQLVAEAMWLLADPQGYRSRLMEKGRNESTATTVRQLKTEVSRRQASTGYDDESRPNAPARIQKTMPRQSGGIFKR
jgi:hypothetical protein